MATKTKAWSSGTGSVTIVYGGQGDGQITITSDANNLHETRSMQIKVKTSDGSNIEKTITISQAMKPYIDLTNAVVTASNQTYNGSAKTPTPTVTLNGTTIPSTGYDVEYSDNINAGTATITVTGKGDYTGTATGTFTINKANSSVSTAPTAKSLTYSRSAQALVNAGSASGGTMYYKYTTSNSKPSSTSGFSSSIPTSTNAGTYYVWYYVKGDSNHNDTAISSSGVSVTISKRTPVVATSPSKRTGLTYNGSDQNLLSGGSMKHSSSDSTSVSGTFSYKQGKNAGSYSSLTWSFTPSDTTNYNSTSGTVSGSVSIGKASRTISFTSAPTPIEVDESKTLAASVSAGSGDGSISFSSSNSSVASVSGSTITGVSIGSCTITASVSEGTNYLSASKTYTVSIVVYDYVDLGTGVLWAKCNVGASNPEDFGDYFSWGDIDGHSEGSGYNFNSDNYNNGVSGSGHTLTADFTSGNSSYDGARANEGSPWRVPTKLEAYNMFRNTDHEWTTVNGVPGAKFMNKSDHSKYIFIPAAGYYNGTTLGYKTLRCCIWTTYYNGANNADYYVATSDGTYTGGTLAKLNGLSIRAVRN